MKTKKLFICALSIVAMFGCNKQKLTDKTETNNTVDYGVSVKDGRLRFESFNSYLSVLKMEPSERESFYNYLDHLPNFRSKKKSMLSQSNTALKINTECNCFIDDDYTNSICDSNYMVIIEDFTVKLDGCNEMVYVSDNLTYGATQRIADLIACDFSDEALYPFYFADDVEHELPIIRDSLNNIDVAGRRCTEVPISNRVANHASGVVGNPGLTYPAYELEYKNQGISGKIVGTFDALIGGASQWQFAWERYFKKRCEGVVNIGPVQSSKSLNGGEYKYTIYSGTRLTNAVAGVDSWWVKLYLENSKFGINVSPTIMIVP